MLSTQKAVAVPAAVRRNSRRVRPSRRARRSASSASRRAAARCRALGGRGHHSPFETSERGKGKSASSPPSAAIAPPPPPPRREGIIPPVEASRNAIERLTLTHAERIDRGDFAGVGDVSRHLLITLPSR